MNGRGMSMQERVEHDAWTKGAKDAKAGVSARPEYFNACAGSAWEAWYMRGHDGFLPSS